MDGLLGLLYRANCNNYYNKKVVLKVLTRKIKKKEQILYFLSLKSKNEKKNYKSIFTVIEFMSSGILFADFR